MSTSASPTKNFKLDTIYVGNNIDQIRQFPSHFVHCIVTSPPYFNLRDYGTEQQIFGGDPTCDHDWKSFIRKGMSGGKRSSVQAGKGEGRGDRGEIRGRETQREIRRGASQAGGRQALPAGRRDSPSAGGAGI